MNKRGLTAREIIITLLAIVGFVIVLFFVFAFNIEQRSQEEICRISVLKRGSVFESTQAYIPLQCTTKKICLSLGDKCDEQFLGEDSINEDVSSPTNEQSAKKIEKISAEEMYNCWSIMGEGKLNLFADKFEFNLKDISDFLKLEERAPKCVICSRIALSPELKKRTNVEKKDILDLVDVNNYLQTELVPGSTKTYINTFTDRQVNAFPAEVRAKFNQPDNQKKGTDEIAYIFTQLKTAEDPATAAMNGATIAGGFLFGGTYSLGMLGKAISHPIISGIVGTVAIGGTAGLRALGAYNDQQVSAGHCGTYTQVSEDKAKYGCSFVMPVDYNNVEFINNLCSGGIEGNP
ncbi:MAG: hypothetical protein KJ718_06485 [Nanoarchaeota archaeon]|nr:hypothetical protein [Nanoarchaeota archaeon]MBU1052165.1 hypothetical protein [Nanoarchaeota archaeon]MBU1987981.1 hypothetical protein [Nanoarchaeota archaeon]